MILLFTLIVILFFAILISWIRLVKDSKAYGHPGPFPLPLVGNGLLFLGDSSDSLKTFGKLKDDFGRVVQFYLSTKRYILLSSPKLIEGIISGTEFNTKGESYDYLHEWLGQGLLTSTGNRWRTHRKFLTPAFHFNILQNFLPIFHKNGNILVEKLRTLADGRDIDLFPIIALVALDNVTESIMGTSINAQTDSESQYVKAVETLSVIVTKRMCNPFMSVNAIFNLLPSKKKQDEAINVLHGQTNKVIAARRQDLQKLNINSLKTENEHGIKNRHAFLDLLLLAETDGKKIDDVSVREEVDTFMFEGHDTTTSGIVFCLYCISNHPQVQEKLIQEQRDLLADDFLRDPTYSELQQMKYLDQVIRESLRIFPSVPFIDRLITRDTEVYGMKLPRNTSVLIDIFHMHRDPELFENPLEFRPERFETAAKGDSSFNWLAFSAGSRNCIGQKFAMVEMKAVVSTVLKHYEILPSGRVPILTMDLILRAKDGVHIKLRPRKEKL